MGDPGPVGERNHDELEGDRAIPKESSGRPPNPDESGGSEQSPTRDLVAPLALDGQRGP